jgi:hypothetical protein
MTSSDLAIRSTSFLSSDSKLECPDGDVLKVVAAGEETVQVAVDTTVWLVPGFDEYGVVANCTILV